MTKSYFVGISWFILSILCSITNDIISKYAGLRLPAIEIAFFRFLFSAIGLIPFILYYGKDSLKSERPLVHFIRGSLFFCGIIIWTNGLNIVPITTATLISFTIPLFTLVLAIFFLNENIIWQRWLATIIGFLGIIVILEPHANDFNPQSLFLVAAAIMFASLDIINKKFVLQETMLSMLFYSAIVTTTLALVPTINTWVTPEPQELVMLCVLGVSANLILYFLLKSFAIIEATAVAPYRYLELFFSASLGFIIFNEVPKSSTWIGALIVIPTTLFIIYSEKKTLKA